MKTLIALLLVLEEAIVAVSSTGPVSLLEIRWARELGLAAKSSSVVKVAEDIVLSRVVLQRYQESYTVGKEEMKSYLNKARELGLPDEFSVPFIKGMLLLSKVRESKFGTDKKTYLLWRQSELKRQGFKIVLPELQRKSLLTVNSK